MYRKNDSNQLTFEDFYLPFGGHLRGDSHADAVSDALAQRSRRCLDTDRVAEFRVPRGRAVDLAEVFQVIQGKSVAGQVQHAVEERRGMATG